jgi:hypothetical protein
VSEGSGSGSGSSVSGQSNLPSLPLPSWFTAERKRSLDKLEAARKRALDQVGRADNVAEQAVVWKELIRKQEEYARELKRQQTALTFTPGDGLELAGDQAQQDAFLEMLRREMARSPTFHDLMLRINQDRQHPLYIQVFGTNTMAIFDNFVGAGAHVIDMADFAKVPVDPPPGFPEAATQGEWLAHAMAEARTGATATVPQSQLYLYAHTMGIDAGNAYRRDRGQEAMRTRTDSATPTQVSVTYARNGTPVYRETFDRDKQNNVTAVGRHTIP